MQDNQTNMSDVRLNAIITALRAQRDSGLDAVVNLSGELSEINESLNAAEKKLIEAQVEINNANAEIEKLREHISVVKVPNALTSHTAN